MQRWMVATEGEPVPRVNKERKGQRTESDKKDCARCVFLCHVGKRVKSLIKAGSETFFRSLLFIHWDSGSHLAGERKSRATV